MARDRKRRRFEAAKNRDKTSSKASAANKPSKASQRLAIQAPRLPDIGMGNSYTKQHVFQRGLARGQKPHKAAKTALAAGTPPSMRGPGSKFQQTMKALDQYKNQAKAYRQAVRKQEKRDKKKNRA